MQTGWDVKRMQKLIVMSGTYRQSSNITPESHAHDPQNRLLARGPRFRLDAEMLRDNALFLSGLLVEHIGGKSVRPYQPAGLWKAVGYSGSNTVKFVRDDGEKLYRRSMYTFWKRTSPPPSMITFDAPSRESCTVRRARTNTPLQALVLLNDEQYVEAARKFAERIMTEGGDDARSRIEFAFRAATARRPTAEETQLFLDLFQEQLAEYQHDAAGRGETVIGRRSAAKYRTQPRRTRRLDHHRQHDFEPERNPHQGVVRKNHHGGTENTEQPKYEARNSKPETNSKYEIPMTKIDFEF